MSQPLQQLTRVVRYVFITLVMIGCGSTSAPRPAASPTTRVSTTVVSTSPSSNGTYQTKIFRPGFSVDVPAGWIVLERDTTAAQIYVQCDTCAHGGEENGEITLDSTLAALSPEDTIARLRGASNVDPHAAAGGAAQEFASTASEIVKTIQFTG